MSRRTLWVVVFVELALSLALLFYLIPKNSIVRLFSLPTVRSNSALLIENTDTISNQEPARSGLPVRLKIPTIGVDAAVEYVGITSDGAMDVPKDPTNVAWFNLGARPGENGSAVMAGHYGGKKASVFDNLYKLRKGDKLYIENDKGVIVTFVVRETRRYDPSADASYVFGSNDGKSHLNLITCEGEWNKTDKSYSQRLVVFTDME